MSKIFRSYQGGGPGPLPPGYMQAATAPGRHIAAGLQSLGESIGQAIRERSDRKRQRKAYESYLKNAHGATDDELADMSLGALQGLSRAKEGELMSRERQLALQERQARLEEMGEQRKGVEYYLKNAHGLTDKEVADMSLGELQGLARLKQNEPVKEQQNLALRERQLRLEQLGAQQTQSRANQDAYRTALQLSGGGRRELTTEQLMEIEHRHPDADPATLMQLGTTLGNRVRVEPVNQQGVTGVLINDKFFPSPEKQGLGYGMTKASQDKTKEITDLLWKTPEIKEYRSSLGAYRELKGLFESQSSGPGDIGMVFKFMKSLDPQSVVREGEFASAENSGGVPERILAVYNKYRKGERLPEAVRSDFVKTARSVVESKRVGARSAIEQLKEQARKFKIPEEAIAWGSLGEVDPAPPASASPRPLLSTPPAPLSPGNFRRGQQVMQGGRRYQFDGTTWKQVQ